MNIKHYFKINIDTNRIYGLDILRAFAILFVVIGHGNVLLPKSIMTIVDWFLFDGVSIFFVLSGFLIGGLLIKILQNTHTITKNTLLNFWIRRWFRTLPNYFLTLFILLFLNLLFTEKFNPFHYWRYFIFSQNLYFSHPKFFYEAWSLAIEEWFYLLIPIALFCSIAIFKIKTKYSILLTVLGVLVLVTLFRYYRFLKAGLYIPDIYEWDLLFRKQVITRLDGLMYGFLGAYIQSYFKDLWIKRKLLFFILGIFIFVIIKTISFVPNNLYNCVFCFSLSSAATLLLLPYLSELKSGSGFLYRAISCVSLISYSMYLLNLSIVRFWIIDKIKWEYFSENAYLGYILKYGLYWVLVLGLSTIVYKYFEIPMTNLRDNINKKNA
ncbi:MAG: acyltransferase [Sphingobacteriales bacterium]|nr:MAG: acyltransferase [Sphingobacteriales bacterium]